MAQKIQLINYSNLFLCFMSLTCQYYLTEDSDMLINCLSSVYITACYIHTHTHTQIKNKNNEREYVIFTRNKKILNKA